MTGIVSGNSLGLELTSLATLERRGAIGTAAQGQAREQTYVNVANGNLVLRDLEDRLESTGLDVEAVRTYNSQGLLSDDNGDNWSTGFYKQQLTYTGTLNAAGSTVTRTAQDGSQAVYTYDATTTSATFGKYVTTMGAGAYDTIAYTNNVFVWTDGATGAGETYTKTVTGEARLTSATDNQGSTIAYEYDASGLISKLTGASGEAILYTYTTGKLQSVKYVSATGVQTSHVTYTYDNKNRLTGVSVDLTPANTADNLFFKTTYGYDGQSTRVASVTQGDGVVQKFTYASVGGVYRVASVQDGVGKTTTYSYDTANRKTTVTDPLGRATVYEYDTAGQLVKVTEPAVNGASSTLQYAYNTTGDLITVTDAMGSVTTMEYTLGNRTLERDALGNTTRSTYNSKNQLLTQAVMLADPDGAGPLLAPALVTRNVYDVTGLNLRFQISPEGRVTEHRYNAAGQRINTLQYASATYDASALVSYDANGVPTFGAPNLADLTTWSAGKPAVQTDYHYDFRGQLDTVTQDTAVASATRAVTTYVRDAAGLLKQTVSATGATSIYDYDGMWRLTSSRNAAQEYALTTYNDAGSSIKVTSANGLMTTTATDAAGRVISVVQGSSSNANLGTTKYAYDAAGQLLMVEDPTQSRSFMLYDAAGRKVADIDGSGTLTESIYNKNDQVTHTVTYSQASVAPSSLVSGSGVPLNPTLASIRPQAAAATDLHTWNAYDTAGRLVKSVDGRGAVSETVYDNAGRVVAVIQRANLLANPALLGDTPLASDMMVAASADDRIARNFYDADNLLRGTLDAEGFLTENKYNALGQLISTTRYAKPTPTAARASGTLTDLIPSSDAHDITTTYLRNAQSQVCGEVDAEGYLTESVYDLAGNRTQAVRYATKMTAQILATSTLADLRPTTTTQDRTSTWSYDTLGRVASETDAQGTVTRYAYDNAGNVVKTESAFGQPEVRTLMARYDIQGRLVGELSAEGAQQLTGNQTQAQIDQIWTNWGLTHAYDAAGRRISTTDAYGNRTLFYYNADSQLTHTVSALGEVSENQYNALGRLSAAVRYDGKLSPSNLTGGLVTSTFTNAVAAIANSAKDSRTSYTWDAGGTLASQTDALGFTKNYLYNAFGQERSRTEALGAGSFYTQTTAYDHRGLVATTISDVGSINATETKQYDAFGRVVGSTDANGHTRTLDYDRLGRQVVTQDALGARASASYDAFDRVLTRTDELGNVTSYAYDKNARSIVVTSPEGIAVTTVFDRFGQTLSVSDARNASDKTLYTYDIAGQLTSMDDLKWNPVTNRDDSLRLTTFVYDLAGNRVRETTKQATEINGVKLPVVYQDNFMAYDALGRLKWTHDGRTDVTIDYDKVGNRQHVHTSLVNGAQARQTTDSWFYYDAMNRQVFADVNADGTLGDKGHRIAYDKAGNKVSDSWMGNVVQQVAGGTVNYTPYGSGGTVPMTQTLANTYKAQVGLTTETYTRDALGRIKTITRDGTVVDSRYYDAGGRLVQSGQAGLDSSYLQALNSTNGNGAVLDGNGSEIRKSQYDGAGRMAAQSVLNSDGTLKYNAWYNTPNNSGLNVDGAGNVLGYRIDQGGHSTDYTFEYDKLEGYEQKTIRANRDGQTGTTTNTFDAAGNLVKVDDDKQDANDRTFVNDAAGKVLYVNQDGHIQRQTIVNGEVLGRYGEAVNDLEARSAQGVPQFKTVADFAFASKAAGGDTPNLPDMQHTVGAGDTMEALAQSYLGDSRLWYRIAEANGLSSNEDLRAGQVLKIPGTERNGNASNTFRPYQPGEVVGDTSPYVPLPAPKSSSFFGKLLMVVVAVLATVYTAGAFAAVGTLGTEAMAAAALEGVTTGGGFAATMSAGASVLGGSAGAGVAAAAGAMSGAVGSIASQGVGMALGMQSSLNWKAVASSAVSGGVTGGLTGVDALAGPGVQAAAMRAATASVLTQGISVVAGLQSIFSWRNVAASAVGAGVGTAVGGELNSADAFDGLGRLGGAVARGTVASMAGGLATAVMHGGRISVAQIGVDSFGSTIGNSLAEVSSGFNNRTSADDVSEITQSDAAYGSNAAGAAWGADVSSRRLAIDPLGIRAMERDSASVMARANALWGSLPSAGPVLSESMTDADILSRQMRDAGYDGDMVSTGGSVRVSPGTGLRPGTVNGVSVNQRADAAFQAAGDLAGMGDLYRDYKLLGGLMSEVQQETTLSRLKGALQDKLGMMRVAPSAEALGATPGIGADGSIRYDKADLIDRYGDALRKVEMWKQGVIELDTRSMLITSIGNQKMTPAQWVEENTQRYQRAFAAGVEDGQQRYSSGQLRYPADMPRQLQVGLYADAFSRDVLVRYNERLGVPEGPGQLLVMNRWAYDPTGSGMTVRPDVLLDLGPNRPNEVLRFVVDGKTSMAEAMASGAQFGRTSNWLGGAAIKAATPQGLLPWSPRTKGR